MLVTTLELISHPELTTDLLLVRHGQTDWNVERRIQGWRPIPLNAEGQRQAAAAARLLAHITPGRIISSPILRAVQTTEILCDGLGLAREFDTHPGLGEFKMGAWEGHSVNDLRGLQAWSDYIARPDLTIFPEGESMVDIWERTVSAVNGIVAEHGGGSLVLVSHGGLVRLLLLAAYGVPLSGYHRTHVDNASISHIRLLPGRPPRVLAVSRTAEPVEALRPARGSAGGGT